MIDLVTVDAVVDARSLANYAQQRTGTPYPTGKDIAILTRQAKLFLKNNPTATWTTLAKVVDWAKAHKKRPATTAVLVSWARYAFADGYLPELDPTDRVDEDVETAIAEVLSSETDPEWRRQLLACQGVEARRTVLMAWRETHLAHAR